uniref:Uncharacterized protein n=1 Tax=Arundo donax TaxID=35708 RepID=A0A0A9AUC7_ARUDO
MLYLKFKFCGTTYDIIPYARKRISEFFHRIFHAFFNLLC